MTYFLSFVNVSWNGAEIVLVTLACFLPDEEEVLFSFLFFRCYYYNNI